MDDDISLRLSAMDFAIRCVHQPALNTVAAKDLLELAERIYQFLKGNIHG